MTIQEAKQKLIRWAEAQVGTREGANNWNKYAEDPRLQQLYGWRAQNQPWCDLFTDEAFIECFGLEAGAAMTYQPIGQGSAACRYSAQFFKNAGAWSVRPELGAVIFFYYDGAINHQGIVVGVSDGMVSTVEGNSSDIVARRSYVLMDGRIAGYGIPNWAVVNDQTSGDAPVPTPEVPAPPAVKYHSYTYDVAVSLLKKGDYGPQVKHMQQLLNANGFECEADGEFGAKTYDALKKFQKAAGIGVDGEWGGESFKAMWNYGG